MQCGQDKTTVIRLLVLQGTESHNQHEGLVIIHIECLIRLKLEIKRQQTGYGQEMGT